MGLLIDLVLFLAAVVSSPVWIVRLAVTGKWRTDWAARFGRVTPALGRDPAGRKTVLIHAVSVGEVNGIRALVAELARTHRVVISVTTDTGAKRAKELFEPAHRVVRYPLDFSFAVRRFLDAVGPDFVALMELEVWPNFVRGCTKRVVPVCVINGRISARSFKRYSLIAPLLRPTFRQLAGAAAQTRDYADRFAALGVPADRVQVLDTMKWDTANIAEPSSVAGVEELAAALGVDRSRPVVVVGSSAPQEHQLLIDACPDQAQMILVPRKPEWFDDVAQRLPGVTRRTQSPDCTRRDVNDPATRDARGRRFFLLDTIGELRKAYALADVAVVGRSFAGLYGSDMIEPIALGRPTIIGPCHSDFADTMAAFLEGDGIIVAEDPAPAIARLLADRAAAAALAERGRRVILSRQGATLRHAEMIRRLFDSSTNH